MVFKYLGKDHFKLLPLEIRQNGKTVPLSPESKTCKKWRTYQTIINPNTINALLGAVLFFISLHIYQTT
jgi:hypothetical protein